LNKSSFISLNAIVNRIVSVLFGLDYSWNEVSNDSLNVLNRLELEEGREGINLTKIIISVVVFIAILKALEFFI